MDTSQRIGQMNGRLLALAHAETIDSPKAVDHEPKASKSFTFTVDSSLDRFDQSSRKRHKTASQEKLADFVHLPHPSLKMTLEDANCRPFRPIAVLSDLNEPPPSAALLPPISSSRDARNEWTTRTRDCQSISIPFGHLGHEWAQSSMICSGSEQDSDIPELQKPRKKPSLRPRRKWSEAETEALKKGIAIYGVGRWKSILDHPSLEFASGRTHVDLKDRFRVMFPPKNPEKWVGKATSHNSFNTAARNLPPKQPRRRALYVPWSEVEDVDLDRGFSIHGYQWHLIAKDTNLMLANRTAVQIRDRFRRRYPEVYNGNDSAERHTSRQYQPRLNGMRQPGVSETTAVPAYGILTHTIAMGDIHTGPLISQNDAERRKGIRPGSMASSVNHDDGADHFSKSLAELGELTLAPVNWDDMAVQPVFDVS